MKINELRFAAADPITKTLKIGDAEYTVGIKQIAFGDMERIGSNSTELLTYAVVFDDGQHLTKEQAARLDWQTAVSLLALVNEVNAVKN